MFHNDIAFEEDPEWNPPIGAPCECGSDKAICWRHENEVERTAQAQAFYAEMKRKREAEMLDTRTERLAKLLSVANRLNHVENDVKMLWLNAENDAENLRMLLDRVHAAAYYADVVHNDHAARVAGDGD